MTSEEVCKRFSLLLGSVVVQLIIILLVSLFSTGNVQSTLGVVQSTPTPLSSVDVGVVTAISLEQVPAFYTTPSPTQPHPG